ncbi:MAG TPA: uroporphyrinogen decarboxylase family protein [Clostridiales bacterium]|nr:MAG: methylcobalamin:coenzyme M methyltransferase [Firmicutes bacterium ADurb.Bin262]HOU10111.1 uroporphyrinogen decarboxylase family protein [Clostridiales bacterium]HQK72209.1 uroporphyrinogen decarboxylase family protein [Clostridiales bacterium]
MKPMTTHERFSRMYAHEQADRVPIVDSPWAGTLARWRKEGMPKNVPWYEYFGVDHTVSIDVDNSPRYKGGMIELTPDYTVFTTNWGATLKRQNHADSTPEFLDFKVKTPDDWLKAKARMTPVKSRVDWSCLKRNYKTWRENGEWIEAGFWFGFDVTHSWFIGTERLLVAMAEQPEWCVDMFNHFLDLDIALFDMVWDAGYTFDCISWPDDMGYKQNQFFSLKMYRELLKPVQKRAVEWAHAKGIPAHLHSCGDIRPFIPELVEIGVDALNPIEVKAGMDPYAIKKEFGDKLVLHGGLNAVLWDDADAVEEEMRRLIPALKTDGGYIFSSDHSIPNSVSLATMRRIADLAKELGAY